MVHAYGLWCLVGFAVTSLCGTLLHFLYEWTGGAVWAALISGVNESTWEHMKLLFVPMLIFAALQSFFFRGERGFWRVSCRGMCVGLVLIPVLFYTYNGVIGKSPDWVNIAIFFIAAAAAYAYQARQWKRLDAAHAAGSSVPDILFLCAIAFLFGLFTFFPPHIGLFRDPVTGGYGIPVTATAATVTTVCRLTPFLGAAFCHA